MATPKVERKKNYHCMKYNLITICFNINKKYMQKFMAHLNIFKYINIQYKYNIQQTKWNYFQHWETMIKLIKQDMSLTKYLSKNIFISIRTTRITVKTYSNVMNNQLPTFDELVVDHQVDKIIHKICWNRRRMYNVGLLLSLKEMTTKAKEMSFLFT